MRWQAAIRASRAAAIAVGLALLALLAARGPGVRSAERDELARATDRRAAAICSAVWRTPSWAAWSGR